MYRRLCLILLGCGAGGCGHQSMFLNPDTDLAFYEAVGIAPFENLAADPTAAAAVARVLRTELWAQGRWRVASEGDWVKAEREVRQKLLLDRTEMLTTEAVRDVGERLGVQGIFFGTVRNYVMVRVGQDEFPLVAFSLQFVDVPTGQVVWDISLAERGGPKFPIFGFGETHTLADLTAKLCARAVGKLVQ